MVKKPVKSMSNWSKDVEVVQENHTVGYDFRNSAEMSSPFLYFIFPF